MTEAGRITAIIDGDISALTSKLAQAKSQAVSSVSGIESEMRGKVGAGISGALSGGDYSKAGKQIGGSLVDGITAERLQASGAASAFLCGNAAMVNAARLRLLALGLGASQIHADAFAPSGR
jgi:ferredoxin-NADP reductase